jgi:hypothetical protein
MWNKWDCHAVNVKETVFWVLLVTSTLRKEAGASSETFLSIYQSTRRHNYENRGLSCCWGQTPIRMTTLQRELCIPESFDISATLNCLDILRAPCSGSGNEIYLPIDSNGKCRQDEEP